MFKCFKSNRWRRSPMIVTGLLIFLTLNLQRIVTSAQKNPMYSGRISFNNQPQAHSSINEQERIIRSNRGEILMQNMNLEADPCKDFFDYACGKWAEENTPSHSGEILTTGRRLETIVNEELQTLLSKINNPQANQFERRVQNFYQLCLKVDPKSDEQSSFMRKFLKDFGGLPSMPNTNWQENYDWLRVVAALRVQYGFNILINFEIDKNLEERHGNSIYLGEPKTTIIPPENCSEDAITNRKLCDNAFNEIEHEIADNMQNWINMDGSTARRLAAEILQFELGLCKYMRVEQSVQQVVDNRFEESMDSPRHKPVNTRGQSRLYGNRALHTLDPASSEGAIDFWRYVKLILNTPYNEPVYFRNEPYLQHLAVTIKTTHKTTLAKYIMYRALSELNFPKRYGANQRERAPYCVQLVQRLFPKQTGEMCRIHFQNPIVEESVVSYFNDITKALDGTFEDSWMSEGTKRAARQKLAEFKVKFPIYHNLEINLDPRFEQLNYWQKLSEIIQLNSKIDFNRLSNADPDERLNTIEACDVRAKLMPLDKEVLLGWGLVQQPLYNRHYPRALNYASLGQQMARELSMAFDEQGWRPTPLSQRQWDEYTTQAYRNLTECYRTQYSNYLYNNPKEFYNSTRLREVIADSTGLNLAFTAYLQWLENEEPALRVESPLKRETLANINFTNTQLFFISFAQSRCAAKFGERTPPMFFPMDKHTPERYDVIGPISNNPEFAREFGCTLGDEMHPADKCLSL